MSQPASTLLQYVDNLLLAVAGPATCLKEDSLQLLATLGYRVSMKKAGLYQMEVSYLGSQLSQGRKFNATQKEAILKPRSRYENFRGRQDMSGSGFLAVRK